MTWKEFKDKVELLGVQDESQMGFIDWDGGSDPKIFKSSIDRPFDPRYDWNIV